MRKLMLLACLLCSCSTPASTETPKPAVPFDRAAPEFRARNLTPTASTASNVILQDATVMTTGEVIEKGDAWIRDGKTSRSAPT
ncbi:MAG: hypothetical protein R3E66_24860 [bacterium]